MRYINLEGSGGPVDDSGVLDTAWLAKAQRLLRDLEAAADKAARDDIIDQNKEFWGKLRGWLLNLSYQKCWFSEARAVYSVLEVEHFRPKKRCKRQKRAAYADGYWWLAFEWTNYRLCGKVGNAKKGDMFPLAASSPVATYNGTSILNEIPLLLDPACPGDPDLLDFNEDGEARPHPDADAFTLLRVNTTTEWLNLNQGRVKDARQRVWNDCWNLINECRDLAVQMDRAPGPAERERLNRKKEELRKMVRPTAEFSAVARACLLKSNLTWVRNLVAA